MAMSSGYSAIYSELVEMESNLFQYGICQPGMFAGMEIHPDKLEVRYLAAGKPFPFEVEGLEILKSNGESYKKPRFVERLAADRVDHRPYDVF